MDFSFRLTSNFLCRKSLNFKDGEVDRMIHATAPFLLVVVVVVLRFDQACFDVTHEHEFRL
jgi:hypothetical protein